MKTTFYRQKWAQMKTRIITPEEFMRLARQIAYSFMDSYLKDCRYEADFIDLLCEMTTVSEDAELNGIAAQALFSIIIESLCDEFEDLQTETYNRVMAQIISFCRRLRAAEALDRCLHEFGIYTPDDLLARIEKIRGSSGRLASRRQIAKILLLSRVTLGADVAINSIVIQRLTQLFPAAEIVLIGGGNLDELYGGNSKIRFRKVDYKRQGGLLERLSSWQSVLNIIGQELADCPLPNAILIDPDSRLSQLGVLPLLPPEHYFFFDSRSQGSLAGNLSMGQLTNAWLDRITGGADFFYPKVWLPQANIRPAKRFYETLKANGAGRVIAVNFGVGGNPRKKVGGFLEQTLLLALLKEPATVILLDKGFGDAELQHAGALLKSVKAQGYAVHDGIFADGLKPELNWGVIGLQTRIGEIAALIAACDEYIGYDSACQHIAAALETPCLTIFAGSNNMRFIRRWSAFGPNTCRIVHVDTLTDPTAIDVEDIVFRIMIERKA